MAVINPLEKKLANRTSVQFFGELIKFMYTEKATTKVDKIFTFNLTICSNRQIEGEDFVNFCGLLRKHEV